MAILRGRLQEDRNAIILADRPGYYDAFVGEYLTDKCRSRGPRLSARSSRPVL